MIRENGFLPRLQVSSTPYKARNLRRTSSLQLPNELNKNKLHLEVVVSALSSIKNSTMSMYASTLSAVGLLDARGPPESSLNLYPAMERYRCCCGMCRLKMASTWIGIFSILYTVAIFVVWFYHDLNTGTQNVLQFNIPTVCFLVFNIISSTTLVVGVTAQFHYLLVLNVMGSMGLGMFLMLSTDKFNTQLFPAFAICSLGLVAVYLWFLVVVCMTFVLIRDQKNLKRDRFALLPTEPTAHYLERVNSAQF